MSVEVAYRAAIASGRIEPNCAQQAVLPALDALVHALQRPVRRWMRWRRGHALQGIYLVGPVGAGKTLLMDLLFEAAPAGHKARMHFHAFMRQVDTRLRALQGIADPLRHIARETAASTRLLCLDELLVYDVAQAMMLAELFTALLSEGLVLVFTSNTPPDDLYRDGIQRERFLPAIALIKSHCQILQLTPDRDFRLKDQPRLITYFSPLQDNAVKHAFETQCNALIAQGVAHGTLNLLGRDIAFIKAGNAAIWFDFSVLCQIPRSVADYLALSEQYFTVCISEMPVFDCRGSVQALLLTQCIDVFYERQLRVILWAERSLADWYEAAKGLESFERTISRLVEMQSQAYYEAWARRYSA